MEWGRGSWGQREMRMYNRWGGEGATNGRTKKRRKGRKKGVRQGGAGESGRYGRRDGETE